MKNQQINSTMEESIEISAPAPPPVVAVTPPREQDTAKHDDDDDDDHWLYEEGNDTDSDCESFLEKYKDQHDEETIEMVNNLRQQREIRNQHDRDMANHYKAMARIARQREEIKRMDTENERLDREFERDSKRARESYESIQKICSAASSSYDDDVPDDCGPGEKFHEQWLYIKQLSKEINVEQLEGKRDREDEKKDPSHRSRKKARHCYNY